LLEVIDKHDWKISVGSDAHYSPHVGIFDDAIQAIQQAGFNEKNITTMTPSRFLSFLAEHGKPVAEELRQL
jgi:putative hydrolase